LSRARDVFFLVSGEKKRDAIDAWRRGEPIPASTITPPGGVDVMLDTAAWPEPMA
jgi:6-phosphogluconolactonase